MKTLWMELSDAILPAGLHGYTFKGDDVCHRCLLCEALFPQTDEGWHAFKLHGFDTHEQVMQYDWTELHGKQVTIGVVQRVKKVGFGENERASGAVQTELLARTADGVVYFLPNPDNWSSIQGGFKCKPKSPESNLLKIMQPDLA